MEPQFKSSFIPKKPISTQPKPAVVATRRRGIGFFTLLTIILFLGTILFAGGVYAYKLSVKQQIEGQIEDLKAAREQFDPRFIAEATRLNERIIAANKILSRHVAPSVVFSLLEESTLVTVQFSNFSFSEQKDGSVNVGGNGVADSFRSVVLQSDEFGDTGYLQNVLFTGLQPNQEGNVNFVFSANLDPKLLLFSRGLISEDVLDDEIEETVPNQEES